MLASPRLTSLIRPKLPRSLLRKRQRNRRPLPKQRLSQKRKPGRKISPSRKARPKLSSLLMTPLPTRRRQTSQPALAAAPPMTRAKYASVSYRSRPVSPKVPEAFFQTERLTQKSPALPGFFVFAFLFFAFRFRQ
jgi:hypothetical protein